MYKIYSRRRFLIKPFFKKPRFKPKSKAFKICVILMVIIIIIKLILNYIEPVFETMCEENAKSIATIITNQQSTIIMNNYKYEQLYSIEKDDNGDIVIIKANVIPIMSYNSYNEDTKFGKAQDFIKDIENITGNNIIHTIQDAEPIGPKHLTDIMIVCPASRKYNIKNFK